MPLSRGWGLPVRGALGRAESGRWLQGSWEGAAANHGFKILCGTDENLVVPSGLLSSLELHKMKIPNPFLARYLCLNFL